MIGRLFNLCSAAQSAAAALAMGLPVAATCTRDIERETLREHALVIFRDWAKALGMAVDVGALRGLGRLSVATADVQGVLNDLERATFGGPASSVLDDIDSWREGAATVPAEMLRRVADWPAGLGRLSPAVEPTFVARVIGNPLSTPVLGPFLASEGLSLYVRMLARVFEVALLITSLRSGGAEGRCGRETDGRGWAEAARGRLTHSAICDGDRVMDYRIRTPTDAMLACDEGSQHNFLAALIESAHGPGDRLAAQRVALALACVDPCLPVIWQTTGMDPRQGQNR
ncbi:hypothetical protein ACUN9Y_10230 [Halomonas sp. V046]|uniref:hypothetical protein n=1 Tax=Halomonas sp. V046 TaxID=3459611 RepID=UPI004043D5FD